jgi:signal transduction histidine kinase/CheY-like chemotaxis protein
MSPFYVIGSVTAVVTTFVFIRNRAGLLAYSAFLVALTVTLYRMEPSVTKLAYWGGVLTVLPLGYLRLDWQLRREAMQRQMADELEHRVQERTREVRETNARLESEILERKRLEDELRLSHKMDVLGRVAGGLAHDFNNLLTTVNVYAELVLDGLERDTTLYRDAEQILKTTRMASALTQQLLDLSRGSGGAVVIDVNEAIEEVAEMVRAVLPEEVVFETRPCDRPVPVRAGSDQLGRVLTNLIMNALDAMPEGGRLEIAVEVRSDDLPAALAAEPGAEYALLTVTDTGHGMDAETLSRAFDPFFTRKPGREGSGLGLSIVWGIVAEAGGHVRADSATGRGTRFEIWWPLAAEPAAVEGAEAGDAADVPEAERVLLVEDEAHVRTALSRVLREAGYEVVEAGDGAEAWGMLEGEGAGFDLVVSDVVMPEMDGYELCERLLRREPGARVLLMSGQTRHPSLGDRTAPPGVEVLRKPFAVGDLVERARRVLDAPPG